jgi:hypothetical protein
VIAAGGGLGGYGGGLDAKRFLLDLERAVASRATKVTQTRSQVQLVAPGVTSVA